MRYHAWKVKGVIDATTPIGFCASAKIPFETSSTLSVFNCGNEQQTLFNCFFNFGSTH